LRGEDGEAEERVELAVDLFQKIRDKFHPLLDISCGNVCPLPSRERNIIMSPFLGCIMRLSE
jgi:hypothetical protein